MKEFKERLKKLIKISISMLEERLHFNVASEKVESLLEDFDKSFNVYSKRLKKHENEVIKELEDENYIKALIQSLIDYNSYYLQDILNNSNDKETRILQFSLDISLAMVWIIYYHLNKDKGSLFSSILVGREGIGKTIASIIFLSYLYHTGQISGISILIITGNSKGLKQQWKKYVKCYLPWLKKVELKTVSARKFSHNSYEITIVDESEEVCKNSAFQKHILRRTLRKNNFLENVVYKSENLVFLLPTSYGSYTKTLERIVCKKPIFNPLIIRTEINFYNYKVNEPIFLKSSSAYRKIYFTLKRKRKNLLGLIKKLLKNCRGDMIGKLLSNIIKICHEDLYELRKILKEEELKKFLLYVKRHKTIGFVLNYFVVNCVSSQRSIFQTPLFGKDFLINHIKALTEIINSNKGKKILIYSEYVGDIFVVKKMLEELTGEKINVRIRDYEIIDDDSNILLASGVIKEGVNLDSFSIFILFRYPRTSYSKLKNLIARTRGCEIYIIGWDFEKELVIKCYKKLKKYFEGD
ncbi:MAG: hypothetical protein QXS37_05470 [Candidatus Aenigmatarchaeota archaeon]